MALQIRSVAFAHNGSIPRQYTCDGADTSPPLQFAGVPSAARTLALIADDPDAPDPARPKRTFVHWVLFNIPPDVTELGGEAELPAGVGIGKNDKGEATYTGPCPPIGRHRYFFKLYALDTRLELKEPTKAELERAMKGHVVEQAEVVGTYERSE